MCAVAFFFLINTHTHTPTNVCSFRVPLDPLPSLPLILVCAFFLFCFALRLASRTGSCCLFFFFFSPHPLLTYFLPLKVVYGSSGRRRFIGWAVNTEEEEEKSNNNNRSRRERERQTERKLLLMIVFFCVCVQEMIHCIFNSSRSDRQKMQSAAGGNGQQEQQQKRAFRFSSISITIVPLIGCLRNTTVSRECWTRAVCPCCIYTCAFILCMCLLDEFFFYVVFPQEFLLTFFFPFDSLFMVLIGFWMCLCCTSHNTQY